MSNPISALRRFLDHQGGVTLFALVLLLLSTFGHAQTAVLLAPLPQLQFLDQSGRPLAFGCVFTWANNSTTPLATYTDYTGVTLNANPVVLSAGGSANIWMQAGLAYTFRVKAAGGSNCASGSTLYTVNGIGGGVTVLTTVVTYSSTPVFNDSAQNQLFEITLTGDATSQPLTAVGITPPGLITWQITQDGVGGHAFTWPSNVIGGCTIGSTAGQVTTQFFIWNGTNATATGPCVVGNGPNINFGIGSATALQSVCANPATAGFIRLCKTDAVNWRNNANAANQGIAEDTSDVGLWSFAGGFESTGTVPDLFLGGKTASFPRLKRNATAVNFRLGDDSADAPITASTLGLSDVLTSTSTTYVAGAPEVSTPSAPAASHQKGYFKAGKGWCAEDSSAAEYCTATNSGTGIAVQASSITLLGGNVSVPQNSGGTTIFSKAVTMPSAGCPCRAFVSYSYYANAGSHGLLEAWISDGSNSFVTTQMNIYVDGNTDGREGASFSPVTYSNSATVTFTLKVNSESGGGATVLQHNNATLAQDSWINVAIFTSN